jgi:HAD superfamily hydrolase (TIGR01450 family)
MSRSRGSDDLPAALDGVRAFILDADGVLMYRGIPIPGSVGAVERLRARRIPYRVVTNFSSSHRSTLARVFADATGLPAEPDLIITAASAAAVYTATHHPGATLFVLAQPDALREWKGQKVIDVEEADRRDAHVDVVVIGDAGEALSYRNLDIVYRHARAGAAFIAMHRNPWWVTERGPTLDSGAIVAGLEFALGRRAIISGKPSPVVFREAIAELRADVQRAGGPRLRVGEIAMIGDDPLADIAAAMRVGLRGILVLSGKVRANEASGARRPPDAVAASLSEVVAALD